MPDVEGVYDRQSYEVEKADALDKLAALAQTVINQLRGQCRPVTAFGPDALTTLI
jgi:hypothetical protein